MLGCLLGCFAIACAPGQNKGAPLSLPQCDVSDEFIKENAKKHADLYGVGFYVPPEDFVEIQRHAGRVGYIGAEYIDRNQKVIHFHRETIIWMECSGELESIYVGETPVFVRDRSRAVRR
jgi:hypothetical protein